MKTDIENNDSPTEAHDVTGGDFSPSFCSQIPAEVDALARKALLAVDAWMREVNTLKAIMLDADSLLSLIGHRGMIADSDQKHDIERRCIALSGKLRAAYGKDTTALKDTWEDLSSANVRGQMPPLASGVSPAREAGSAGDMPEVPQGRGLSGPIC